MSLKGSKQNLGKEEAASKQTDRRANELRERMAGAGAACLLVDGSWLLIL